MTNEQILYKAIVKAEKNGWVVDFPMSDIKEVLTFNKHISPVVHYWIIFDHSFAKAFWGNEIKYMIDKRGNELFYEEYDHQQSAVLKAWEYHLQQMVLEKDKLKYLEKYL